MAKLAVMRLCYWVNLQGILGLAGRTGGVQVITKSSEATFQSHNPFDFSPSQGMVLSFAVGISLQIPQIFYLTEVN